AVPEPVPDLSPSRLFSSTGALDHLGAGSPPGKNERHPGLGLGDSWQAQMAQIGLMAGTFAGLVALCGGGGCMKYMPDNFLPDFLVTEESATTALDQPSSDRLRAAD